MEHQKTLKKPRFWQFFLAAIPAVLGVLLGALVCVPLITIPLGIGIMFLGCYPLYRVWKKYVHWQTLQEKDPREENEEPFFPNDAELPWNV